jgi:hypothetical protein
MGLTKLLPLVELASELVKSRRAKKALLALPIVTELRQRFRLALNTGQGFELSKDEVQQIGAYLNPD